MPVAFGGQVVVDARFVDVAHTVGVAVHVWTIEEEAEMERLIDLGVDALITDRPTALAAVLDRRRRRGGRVRPNLARSSGAFRDSPSSWPGSSACSFALTRC